MYFDEHCFCTICKRAKIRDGWNTCRTCRQKNQETSTYTKLTQEKDQMVREVKKPT